MFARKVSGNAVHSGFHRRRFDRKDAQAKHAQQRDGDDEDEPQAEQSAHDGWDALGSLARGLHECVPRRAARWLGWGVADNAAKLTRGI